MSQKSVPALVPVHKPDYFQLLGEIDTSPLLDLITLFPETYWENESIRRENDYPVFHSTQHIILRFIEKRKDPRFYYDKPAWGIYAKYVEPVMNEIAGRMGITYPVFPKVMFAKLKAGGIIDMHVDEGVSHQYAHKIHVPLLSNSDVVFTVRDKSIYLRQGHAYEVNNLVKHGVVNNSGADRVHLIFEIFPDNNPAMCN